MGLYRFEVELFVESDLVANDDTATTPHATAVNVEVLANDTLGGNPVELSDLVGPPIIVTPPEAGEAVVESDGTITYTPPAGFCGEVTLEYQIETPDEELSVVVFGCAADIITGDCPPGEVEGCGVYDLPDWFDADDPFTVSGADWSATFQWTGADYETLDSDGMENAPDCCDGGTGLTLSQNGNSAPLSYTWNCA